MGEDVVTYGLNVGVPLAVFVAMFLALMKSFSNRFDDLKEQVNNLSDDVKSNGNAIAELSKDVAAIKDRLGMCAVMPSERAAHETVQDHGILAKPENVSADAPIQQNRTVTDTDTSPLQPDSVPANVEATEHTRPKYFYQRGLDYAQTIQPENPSYNRRIVCCAGSNSVAADHRWSSPTIPVMSTGRHTTLPISNSVP